MINISEIVKNIEIRKSENKRINPVHEIVNTYFIIEGIDNRPGEFYKGRFNYGKLATEAKALYTACGESLSDALWSLDAMKRKAEKGKFDWSIGTCLKHDLIYGGSLRSKVKIMYEEKRQN